MVDVLSGKGFTRDDYPNEAQALAAEKNHHARNERAVAWEMELTE